MYDPRSDDVRGRDGGLEDGGADLVHQQLGRRDHVEAASREDVAFAPPVGGGAVTGNGGVDREVGALAEAGAPAVAVEAVGAVAGEEPGVVEGDEGRELR